MKICIVAPYFTPFVRGNEYGLAEALSKLGNEVTILSSKSRAPREKQVLDKIVERDLPFSAAYMFTLFDLFENPLTFGRFSEIKNSDVVMLQEDYPVICHQAFAVAKLNGIVTVLSSERNYVPTDVIKRHGLSFIDNTAGKVVRESVDIYTAHCSDAKRFLKDVVGVRREIEVIHVGVDIELFKPSDAVLNRGNEELSILCVARLHRHKGLKYLIRAMSKVIANVNAKLYILGRGEEETNLKNLAEKLGVSSCIEFIKKSIPNEKMPGVYSSCDLYVQPSIVEPYGIAVLEAMACGRPVVGTNTGGMLDTIEHGKTGFRAKVASSEEIAKYIVQLSDPKLRKKMGRNARERAKKFEWTEIGKKYIKLLNNF